MIFNKNKLIILSLAIILLVSSHTTQAFSFKSFFNNVFGRSNTENTQPAASAIPTKVEVSKPAPVTTEVIKTEDILPGDQLEEVNPAEETRDIIKETEVILKYGMTNSTNVSIVQERLKKLGYFSEVIDGGYGKMTASAVALFQKENNIDGSSGTVVGAYTIKALGVTLLPKDKPLIIIKTTDADRILFLGGGIVTQNIPFNDVYSSDTMQQWNLISPNGSTPKWSKKFYSEAFYFDNKYWVIGGMTNINSTTSMDNSVWSSLDGITWTLVASTVPFSEYAGFKVTTLNSKIYVIGGRFATSGALSEAKVWSSTDGVNWLTDTSSAPFGPRVGHEVVTLNGKIYVIGGMNPTNSTPSQYLRDVWATSDGLNWSLLNASAPFGQLSYPIGLAYKNKIFLMGGTEQGPFSLSKKVWSSPDGITWTLISSAMPYYENIFSAMTDAVVANGKIWLGNGINNGINKLWSTTDGATWEQAPAPLPWSPRYGYRFIAGTQTPVTTPTITVTSPNGGETYQAGQQMTITWASQNIPATTPLQISLEAPFPGGGTFALNPYLVGGGTVLNSGSATFTLPVQGSGGGNQWFQMQYGTFYKIKIQQNTSPTGVFASDVSDNLFTITNQQIGLTDQILFMGGGNENGGYQSFNDVYNNLIPGCLSIVGYSSTSGQPCNTSTPNWNQISANTTASSKWSARRNFQTLHYDNRYWVIGGETPAGLAKDVWNSVDGVSWNQVATTTPFGNYMYYKSIVFNNKIYVVGGKVSPSSTAFAKVWSTTDGINWTTATLPFKDRENPTLGVVNNKLFVIGGVETVGAQSDTWSTTDGINWIQMNYFPINISNGKILRFTDDYYFIGGTKWNSSGTGGSSTKEIRRYNIANDSWDLISNTFPIVSSGFTEIDAVVANGKIWASDQASVSPYTNNLWSSVDGGITWILETTNLPWSPRHAYKMVVQYY